MKYLTEHRLDLGAPGIAAAVLTTQTVTLDQSGDLDPDTPLIIGSVTKSFTAMAVMQLVEGGKVSLDAPAVNYLPDFGTSAQETSNHITVRQLLSHTSGLPTAAGVDPLSAPETTLGDQVSRLRLVPEQDSRSFAYSNANYEVLGQLVERVSGQTYAQYLEQHVLAPLGMTHTYTDLAAATAGRLSQGHRIWFGVGVPTGVFYRADFLPSGFLVSTARDLTHYVSAMLDGGRYGGISVLSPAGVKTLISSSTPTSLFGAAGGYGFGWYVRPTGGLNLVLAPGVAQNVHADVVLVPDRHVGVILLADAESDLYLATIPKFDLAAMNAAAIATTGSATGGLVEGWYLVFDVIVLVALTLYVLTLIRVLRKRTPGYVGSRWPATLFAVWREIVVPVVIILELPRLYNESWRYLITGDVGFVAALITILGGVTIAARISFALRRRDREHASPDEDPAAKASSTTAAAT